VKLLRAIIAFTIGIALGTTLVRTPTGLEIGIAITAAILIAVAALFSRKHTAIAFFLLLAILGTIRAATTGDPTSAISWEHIPRNEERITLEGVLTDDPSPSTDRVRLRLEVEPTTDDQASYLVDIYTNRLHDQTNSNRRSTDFRYGDSYRVSGRFILTTDRGDVAGLISTTAVDLIDSGNGNPIRTQVADLRSNISHHITDALDYKSGGLAAALLVGDRTKLHPETITDFRSSGLSHVLAISGLHIAMIGGIVMAISVWIFGRQRQLYLVVPMLSIWIYAALAGLTPSVTRAAIMFTVYLLARLLGRQRSVLPALALAAVIMLAIDPLILRSISFQLSFAAVLGIAFLSAKIAARSSSGIQESTHMPSYAKRTLTGVVYGMSVSLAATIATAPLVAFHFGEVPVWGIPSTLLIVPVLPLFIAGSLLVAASGAVSDQPIAIAGLVSHGIGNYVSFIANLFANLPFGPIEASGWSLPLISAWYAAFIAFLNRRRFTDWVEIVRSQTNDLFNSPVSSPNSNKTNRSVIYPVVGLWVIVVISFAGFVVSKPTSTDLSATFFETNRGDMIFIETPSGARLLIDGGDDPDLAISNLESVLPPLDRRIDVLLSTHPDADHIGGLQQVVEQFDVGVIIDSGVIHDSNIYKSWAQTIHAEPNLTTAQPDLVVALDEEVTLRVLQTRCVVVECSNFNDEGVVARLEYGDISFLLTGDITAGGETDLIQTRQPIKSTVLRVGHHGSRTSTTQQFLDAVDPALAIVTTGIKNQFGHPHEDVIERLESHLNSESIFGTRNNGTLTVTTNGERVWVTSER